MSTPRPEPPEEAPLPPEGMVDDAPPEHDEDETALAETLGAIADRANPALAKAKEKLRKLVK